MHNEHISRRTLLKSVVVIAGAACAGVGAHQDALAQGKVAKAAMKYQDHPNGEEKCSNCMQFVPPDACKIVEGKISPNGYCIAWTKKT
jgi:hypothetical protein